MSIKHIAKFCSGAAIALVVITALGPAHWQPRTGLGWEIDHFLGYFAITLFVCLAWPRPFVVGGALMAGGALLEGLQALTPDRTANLLAAFYGAVGVLVAALTADLTLDAKPTKRIGHRRVGSAHVGHWPRPAASSPPTWHSGVSATHSRYARQAVPIADQVGKDADE